MKVDIEFYHHPSIKKSVYQQAILLVLKACTLKSSLLVKISK